MTIIVYTKDNCPYCDKTKALLKFKGHTYTEIKIGVDITREEFMNLYPEARTVPQIIMDGNRVSGYTELVKLI